MIGLSDDERKDFGACIKRLVGTEYGLKFFWYMMRLSGYHEPTAVVDKTGNIALNSMVYNEATRAVYANVRSLIPKEKLILIEIEGDEKWLMKADLPERAQEQEQTQAHNRTQGQAGLGTTKRRKQDQEP